MDAGANITAAGKYQIDIGTVTVQGDVKLGLNTVTTMNFSGGNNTADVLDVYNGILTLNGSLRLHSNDSQKPTM